MSDVSQADPFQPDLGSSEPRLPSPMQQARQEPFIHSRNDRPYSQWGTPDFALAGAQKYPGVSPGPLMPQASDFPALIHGATMMLGRFGSRYSGMPAIAMGTYANAFWNAYNAGMKERAATNWQQYQRARQMTIDRQQEENQAYAEVYAAYHDEDGNITDPNAFAQALQGVATKYHDSTIQNALANGQFGMIDRIIGARDSVAGNLQKAAHQEERQRRLDEEHRRSQQLLDEERRQLIEQRKRKEEADRKRYEKFGLPYPGPDAPESVLPDNIPPPDDTAQPETSTAPTTPPDTTTEDTGEDGATPSETAQAKPPTAPTTTGQAPAKPAQPSPYTMPPANQYIDNAARARLMGRKGPIDKIAEDATNAREDEYRKKLDELANDPNMASPEKIDSALRGMGLSDLARDVKTYLTGNYPMSTRLADKDKNDLIIALGAAAGSDVTPDTQKTRAAAKAAYARGGPEARNLLSLGTAAYHIAEFKKTMGPDGKNIPNIVAGLAKYGGVLGPIPGWLANKKDRDAAIELDAEADITLREVERSLVGGIGTQKDRDAVAALGNWKTMGREATVKSVETVERLFKDRFLAARNQFIGQMGGTEKDFFSMLDKSFGNDPDSQAAKETLHRLNDETKGQTAKDAGKDKTPPDTRPPIQPGWSIH